VSAEHQKYRLDWMISVDDHVLEPPNVWQDRVPAKYRDAAPKIVVRDGVESWQYEGRLFPTSGLAAVAGKKAAEISPHALNYADMRPGCYEPKARVDDMDEAGVVASPADADLQGPDLHLLLLRLRRHEGDQGPRRGGQRDDRDGLSAH
jgi:hypothetical protein